MNRILLLLINLWLVGIGDKSCTVATSAIHINDNITATSYSNGINLKCSFTLDKGETFFAIALTARNGTPDNYKEIAGFSIINTKPQLKEFGMDLFGNETTFLKFEENQNALMLTFNNLTCRHEREYKCNLQVIITTASLTTLIKSDTMWISVTVFPSKPEMHSPQKLNDFTNAKRNTRSATLAPKTGTHERYFTEGDNITFLCEGDVGRPEGRFLWQKIISSEEKINYSNISTETIPESCSFDGNSTLTIQVTGEDNQARIRCIVKSELPNGTKHVDSEPLQIHFKVRTPFIALFPNRTIFQEGDSVQLKCKANGNPYPTYSWTKGNSSGEIIVDNDTLEIYKANISDSGLYTCDTSNVVDGTVYSESKSTYINIANKSTTPSRTTIRPSGSDNRKGNFNVQLVDVIAPTSVAVFLIVLVVICVAYKKRQQNKETNSKNNGQTEDMYAIAKEGVYDKPGERRHKHENNCEHYDRANVISNLNNKPIASEDSKMFDCYPTPPGKSKSGGYESVLIDGDIPVLSTESNRCDCHDIEIIKQHNEKYMHNQNKDEETINTSPISLQPVEYTQINEATKLRYINKHKDIDTQTVYISAETQERIKIESGERPIKKDENAVNNSNNKPLANSASKTANMQQGINNTSTRTVDNFGYFDTTKYLGEQQTSGGQETFKRNDQTNTYTNQAFETDGDQ